MKVIIAGSRTFTYYELLRNFCDRIRFVNNDFTEIVSGGAIGADLLGERYAREYGFAVTQFAANWHDLAERPCKIKKDTQGVEYNACAGLNRNKRMAQYAAGGMLIAFWDYKSTGTKHMIEQAFLHGLEVHVIKVKIE